MLPVDDAIGPALDAAQRPSAPIHYTKVWHQHWREKIRNRFGTENGIINILWSDRLFETGSFIGNYFIMEIPLWFNLILIFCCCFVTPPIPLFVIGLFLSWFRILVEVHRDQLHVGETQYRSRTVIQVTIALLLDASLGFIVMAKNQSGAITASWWTSWA
ncbi:unnamed protein product [Ambrosiozyma monospora]|uniref:Unnamed protein product n=1 Tax=Ambrosiozyma monospora TaxID=43982 RepID=A0ACB5U3W0_AMBMO|nr:unnamed protein product [Ambrosiozyma monospora]